MYYQHKHIGFGLGRGLTPMVRYLLAFNISFFLVQEILKLGWFPIFGLVPAKVWDGWIWQLVTYMFLHGGFLHILLNMFVLWMFGSQLEQWWGSREFIKYYFITGIGAGICTALVNYNSSIPTIGASGAIYGLLLAYGLTFPNATIYLYFLLPIKAKYFVILFGVLEFLATISPSRDMVAHLAHLGGMVIGLLYLKGGDIRGFLAGRSSHFATRWRWKRKQKLCQEEQRVKEEVDALLDKINRIGYEKLTRQEKKRLDEASKFLREMSKSH